MTPAPIQPADDGAVTVTGELSPPLQTQSCLVNFVQTGRWFRCAHCHIVIERDAVHYCGADWQIPAIDVPREWIDELRSLRSPSTEEREP